MSTFDRLKKNFSVWGTLNIALFKKIADKSTIQNIASKARSEYVSIRVVH
jgi:hypothetical protein